MTPDEPNALASSTPRPQSRRPVVARNTLLAVRRREPAALGELFESYVGYLFSLAWRLLGNRHTAEDTIQNVFLKVHRAAHQLDPDRDPGPWLVTITYNACREHWRGWHNRLSKKSLSIDASPVLAGTLRAEDRDSETQLLKAEMEERLTRAIYELPEAMRAVVLLHDYRDLTHEEVAEILGLSAPAVRKRYSRALALLRHQLEESPQ